MFKISLLLIVTVSMCFSSDYSDWLKSQNNEYNSYKKSMDDEFSDMLKKQWQEFKTFKEPSPYEKPKPIVVPVVKKEKIVPKKEIEKSPIVKTKIVIKEIEPKPIIKKIVKIRNFNTIDFKFYSVPITIQYDKNIPSLTNNISQESISQYWQSMSKIKYKKLLTQIDNISSSLNLNDWAKYQFIHKLGMTIYQDNNNANLFTWFMLVKDEYDLKIGFKNNNIYLLSTIKHKLYQVTFFTLNKKQYYILTPNGRSKNIGGIYTYSGNYPTAKNKLSFFMNKEINFTNNLQERKLDFKYLGKKYSINTTYSKDLINFYKTFPQSDYNIYFTTNNSTALSNSILTKLAPLVKGKSEIEAVNLLLRFVQTSFKYKTDQKQFDYEKVMFPEETIFYPYSDCEDRSIMFSYLVKNLLSLDVVGVKYHDHLANAVAFNSKVSGTNFRYKNKKYTISDPTYINANAGMAMPQYKNSKFQIISIR